MTILRTIWVLLHLIVSTILLGTCAIGLALFRYRGSGYWMLSRTWCRWILWVSGTPVYVQGLEHVAADRPQIIVANHVSWYDIFAIGAALPKHFRFVAKKELARIPLFGRAWKSAGHISIDRQDRAAAIQSLARAESALRSDNSALVLFPEGTRSADGRLQPFKKGAFMLALGTGVEVLPVAVIGTERIMRKNDWRVHPAAIILRFARPFRPGDYGEPGRDALMRDVRGRITDLLRDVPLETAAARVS
ncbi:MAG: lysophospholipid acyltransferase family protein [Longimicrobiales bacterium]